MVFPQVLHARPFYTFEWRHSYHEHYAVEFGAAYGCTVARVRDCRRTEVLGYSFREDGGRTPIVDHSDSQVSCALRFLLFLITEPMQELYEGRPAYSHRCWQDVQGPEKG